MCLQILIVQKRKAHAVSELYIVFVFLLVLLPQYFDVLMLRIYTFKILVPS